MKVALRCLLTIAIYAAPSILAKNCTVCRDGSAVPNPDLSLNTTSVPQDNQDLALLPLLIGATCGQVEDFIKSFSSDSSECMNATSSANLDFLCGCPGSVQECFLCSNGTSPGNPDYALPFWNVNCSELDYYLGYLSESTCPVIPIVLNPELSVCGCPGITLSCPLCGDGSLVPDPTLPITDVTCAAAQLLATFSTEECTGLQATAGVLCECNNTNASAGACRICGGSTLLPDPALVFIDTSSDFNGTECGYLELYINSGNPNFTCAEYQSMFSGVCCGNGTEQTTMNPTAIDTMGAPSMAPATVAPVAAGGVPTSAPSGAPMTTAPSMTPPLSIIGSTATSQPTRFCKWLTSKHSGNAHSDQDNLGMLWQLKEGIRREWIHLEDFDLVP